MTTEVQVPAMTATNNTENDKEKKVINSLAECPGCGSQTILFSRTIQTFCYRCGMAVTELDKAGMYYEVIVPAKPPKQ